MSSHEEWREVAYLQGSFQLRFNLVGLSEDARFCFATYTDGTDPFIFRVDTGEVVGRLTDRFDVPQHVKIQERDKEWWDWSDWARANLIGEHILLSKGSIKGKFRLFGTHPNHPLRTNTQLDTELIVEVPSNQVILRSISNSQEIQRLNYRWFSGGWASATFSDDGSTIAVVEPIYITFYRRFSRKD